MTKKILVYPNEYSYNKFIGHRQGKNAVSKNERTRSKGA